MMLDSSMILQRRSSSKEQWSGSSRCGGPGRNGEVKVRWSVGGKGFLVYLNVESCSLKHFFGGKWLDRFKGNPMVPNQCKLFHHSLINQIIQNVIFIKRIIIQFGKSPCLMKSVGGPATNMQHMVCSCPHNFVLHIIQGGHDIIFEKWSIQP